MHQDHVASRRRILEDLKRYSIDLFDRFVEPGNTRSRITGSTQIPEVRVPLEGSPELRTSRPMRLWILRKPPVHKTMRSAEDVGAGTTWSNVGQHGVHQHADARRGPGIAALSEDPRNCPGKDVT